MNSINIKSQLFYNYFLVALVCSIIFRDFSTKLIIVFILYNIFFRFISFGKIKLYKYYILIISSPFFINIIFCWNEPNFIFFAKNIEKYLSLVLFPVLIICNKNRIDFKFIIQKYSFFSTLIILFGVFLYFLKNPDFISKYIIYKLNYWELGYNIADFIGIHAPALNMHLVFITSINFYFFTTNNKSTIIKYINFSLLLVSFSLILLIHTRLALFLAILNFLTIIIFFILKNKKNIKNIVSKTLVIFISFLLIFYIFNILFPKYKEKFIFVTFKHIDKIGKLDEIENPENKVSNSLVTRITIWKSALELANKKKWNGYGASIAKEELINYYNYTNQQFLARNKFPVHNQIIDFYLKYGFLGILVFFAYIIFILYLAIKFKNIIILCFFNLFFIQNIFDDFLIRFDGIVFSGAWICIFIKYYLTKKIYEKNIN